MQAGAVKPALEYAALSDYLANHGTSGELTLYAGINGSARTYTELSQWQYLHRAILDLSFEKADNAAEPMLNGSQNGPNYSEKPLRSD